MTKPTKEDKLKVIYEEVARKDLSFGCIFEEEPDEFAKKWLATLWKYGWRWRICCKMNNSLSVDKVIWHLVMIGDCLQWISNNLIEWDREDPNMDFLFMQVVRERVNWLNKPIDDQEDECINFVYNLIVNYKDGSETSLPEA